jgi:hypothetical protein
MIHLTPMITYTVEVITENMIDCPDQQHVDADINMRYQMCKTCHGTTNNPKEVEEKKEISLQLDANGAITIEGVGKMISRDVNKLAALIQANK